MKSSVVIRTISCLLLLHQAAGECDYLDDFPSKVDVNMDKCYFGGNIECYPMCVYAALNAIDEDGWPKAAVLANTMAPGSSQLRLRQSIVKHYEACTYLAKTKYTGNTCLRLWPLMQCAEDRIIKECLWAA